MNALSWILVRLTARDASAPARTSNTRTATAGIAPKRRETPSTVATAVPTRSESMPLLEPVRTIAVTSNA